MHRKDFFDVTGKRYKLFLKTLSNRNFVCEKKITTNLEKKDFWWFYTN